MRKGECSQIAETTWIIQRWHKRNKIAFATMVSVTWGFDYQSVIEGQNNMGQIFKQETEIKISLVNFINRSISLVEVTINLDIVLDF